MEIKHKAQQVQLALHKKGFDFIVKELPASTRTVLDAASAIGCEVTDIAKSIIFKTINTHQPVLVIASGINQINVQKIEMQLEEAIEQPSGKWVKESLGFAIGGVPPLGYSIEFPVFIDETLLQRQWVWAAAGTPNAVFCFPANQLQHLTHGQVINID